MDVHEVAEALGIQPGAVRDAVARGKLAAIRKGGQGKRAGFLLFAREEVERYRRESRGMRGKYVRDAAGEEVPVIEEPLALTPTQEATRVRRRTSARRRTDEVHRKQGGAKLLFAGPGGGTFQVTQNNGVRRTSEREIARWKALGIPVARVDEPTAEMLAAATALNRTDKVRRRESRTPQQGGERDRAS
jgi:Helix-turn-helix domain